MKQKVDYLESLKQQARLRYRIGSNPFFDNETVKLKKAGFYPLEDCPNLFVAHVETVSDCETIDDFLFIIYDCVNNRPIILFEH